MKGIECHDYDSLGTSVKRTLWRGGGGGNQAYSRLSTSHGQTTDCKLDSVGYPVCRCMRVSARTCLVWAGCLGRTIYAQQYLGAKPTPIQFRHR